MELTSITSDHPLRYHIITIEQNYFKYLFKCKEDTNPMIYSKPDTRPFNAAVKLISSPDDFKQDDFSNPFARFDKPFICCWCGNNKPTLTGKRIKDNLIFGKAIEHCYCCRPEIDVYDKNGQPRWKLTSQETCSKGFCSRGCCCCLNNFRMQIFDIKETQELGVIDFKYNSKNTDNNEIIIDFPQNSTKEEKFVLLGVGMMYDYKYYHFGY